MKPNLFVKFTALVAVLSIVLPVARAADQALTSAELNNRALQRRAVEATIWGMPAVSMAAQRESIKRDLKANFGDIIYFSQVAEPRHELLTANNQTPYVLTVLDLRQGPMVLLLRQGQDEGQRRRFGRRLHWPQGAGGFGEQLDSHRREDFWLIARFYGPEQILFDKKWEMPDVEEVK